MISEKVRDAFNEQIKHEMESAYLYLSAAAWFASESLDGMAQWMQAQASEEVAHAMRFYNHIIVRDGKVELKPLAIHKTEWKSALEVFEDAYKHEQFITGKINDLVNLTHELRDGAGHNFLEWFVQEQIEEEASASKVLSDLKRIGDSGHGLLMIDRELSQRQFTAPNTGASE